MLLNLLFREPLQFIAWAAAFVLVISIHEYAHALAGYLQGDNTAKYQGRLTLNPLSHLDPIGTLMVLFAGFGWGRPVPFNPYHLKNGRWGPAIVSFAGPFSNIVVFIVAAVGFRLVSPYFGPENLLITFLITLGIMSLGLAFFNLIPIPPLDGSKILDAVLPDRYTEFKINLLRYGPMILLGLIILGNFGGLDVFGWLFNFVYFFVDIFFF